MAPVVETPSGKSWHPPERTALPRGGGMGALDGHVYALVSGLGPSGRISSQAERVWTSFAAKHGATQAGATTEHRQPCWAE